MAIKFHGGAARKRRNLGLQLDRETTTLPQGTFGVLFNIVGGRVVLTSMIGQVTVIMGATDVKIRSNPTTGSAVEIATDLTCDSDVVQTLYGIDDYLQAMTGGGGAANIAPERGIVLPVGELGITTDASVVGEIKWTITYVPYDDEAYMEVA